MAMVLLTTVLPQETHTGDGDSRWNLVKVYQAVDIVWAVWIFNSVFGKTMQHWIQSGLSKTRFSDMVLIWLTIWSVIHLIGRILNQVYVVPWYLPVQLFWDRFYLMSVMAAYAAIAANLYAASNGRAVRSQDSKNSYLFRGLLFITVVPILVTLIAQSIVAAHSPGANWESELAVCATITLAVTLICIILNIARHRTLKVFGQIKSALTPFKAKREKRALRKLNSTNLFTFFGLCAVVGYGIRLWILGSSKEVHLNHADPTKITARDTAVLMAMSFLEIIFVGVAAAQAADLFNVSEVKDTSPFWNEMKTTVAKTKTLQAGTLDRQFSSRLGTDMSAGSRMTTSGDNQSGPHPATNRATIEREKKALEEEAEWMKGILQLSEEQAYWWKHLKTMTLKEFTTFPNPISEAEIRIWLAVMMFVCALGPVLDIYAGSPVLYWVVTYQLVTRALFGIRLDPLAYIIMFWLKPLIVDRLGWIEELLVAGPPRRQAMINPILPSLAFNIAWHCGWPYGARWLGGGLAATCFAQALYDVCLGCAAFWVLIKLRLVPQEACDVCTATLGMQVEQYCLTRSKPGGTPSKPIGGSALQLADNNPAPVNSAPLDVNGSAQGSI